MLKVPRGHAYEATAVGIEWGGFKGNRGEEEREREKEKGWRCGAGSSRERPLT